MFFFLPLVLIFNNTVISTTNMEKRSTILHAHYCRYRMLSFLLSTFYGKQGSRLMPVFPHSLITEFDQCLRLNCFSLTIIISTFQDGRIRKGDRIIAINQESFTDVTYEQARSILLRLKLQYVSF